MHPRVKINYPELRARLIEKGTNLSRWAREHQYPATTVYEAARGMRSGITAVRIRKQLTELAYEP